MKSEVVNGLFALGGGVVGAILTGAISWIQNSRNRSRSELTIFTGYPEALIQVDSSITEIVELRVLGELVPTVYTLDTRFVNTGTEPLHDGDIHVHLGEEGKVVAVDFADSSAGVRNSLELSRIEEEKGFRLHFKFINPGEEFMVRALLNAYTGEVIPTFRQPGVKTIVRDRQLEEIASAMSAIMEVSFPVLGSVVVHPLVARLMERWRRSRQAKLDRD